MYICLYELNAANYPQETSYLRAHLEASKATDGGGIQQNTEQHHGLQK